MKKELKIFLTAVMFYTRIPCPSWVNHDEQYVRQSVRYVPLIGIIVGSFSWFIYYLSHFVVDNSLSILFSMVAGIFLTGAFHEDGLADVCDGFGGGWSREKILFIMKDSRIGTYGVIGLVMVLLTKFSLLSQLSTLPAYHLAMIFISAHALSRLMAISIIFNSAYVRGNEESKAISSTAQSGYGNLVIASFIALVPLCILSASHLMFIISLVPICIATILLRKYFIRWIGGYTGDCLGATQVVTELVFYLSSVLIWNYTL